MPQATLWFASPFKDWIGQRTLTLAWEGTLTVRELWQRLAADFPALRAHLPKALEEEAMGNLVAVIMDGDILGLEATLRDGARLDILLPLSGGASLRMLAGGIGRGPWRGSPPS
jgi:molybdopterin converting factor small subunit